MQIKIANNIKNTIFATNNKNIKKMSYCTELQDEAIQRARRQLQQLENEQKNEQ